VFGGPQGSLGSGMSTLAKGHNTAELIPVKLHSGEGAVAISRDVIDDI